jgi:MarR-like DNA-binding transcriptional regulator SgrR of sgrS sRNA
LAEGNISKLFSVLQGLRQGDGFSAVLFNLALHKVLKELKLNGNILYKSKEACAYADDTALTVRNTPTLQEMLITLQEIAVKYGLYINEEKMKYMKMTTTPPDTLSKITIAQYAFGNVRNFRYLGVLLNNKRDSIRRNK